MNTDFTRQVSKYANVLIQSKLTLLNKKAIGEENINNAFTELISNIDISEIYNESSSIFQSIIDEEDYEKALIYFNKKSLLKQISPKFSLTLGNYEELVVRLLYTDLTDDLVNAFKAYVPNFS